MTLRNIVYDIREKLKISSDDMDYTDEFFMHLINVKRTFFLKQRFAKFTRNIPEEVKQIICVNLSPVDSIDGASCFGKILRSDNKIPTTIEIGGRSSIIGVRVLDIQYPHLNIIPTERMPYVGRNKWLNKEMYVALDADGYMYVLSTNPQHMNLEQVKVLGVFSDPEAAYNMDCTADNNCEFLDVDYPVEPYLVSDIILSIVKELSPTLNIPEDKVNNSDESDRN